MPDLPRRREVVTARLDPDVIAALKASAQGNLRTLSSKSCQAAFHQLDLHFHDLRREAGSRWMDSGVPLATIQRWLGHSNVSQTSTYLSATGASDFEAMTRFEARQGPVQRFATDDATEGSQRPPAAMTTD